MRIPVWVLLGFALWTLLLLFTTVGVYRWSRILTGRAAVSARRADEPQGGERYRRAMRAHMNCVENLPVYGAIVVAMLAARVASPVLDALAITILVARICQSAVHLLFEQTNVVASIRFAFYFLQAVSMLAMGASMRERPWMAGTSPAMTAAARSRTLSVMPALVAGIHDIHSVGRRTPAYPSSNRRAITCA